MKKPSLQSETWEASVFSDFTEQTAVHALHWAQDRITLLPTFYFYFLAGDARIQDYGVKVFTLARHSGSHL